jgi:hypothetical protein
MIYFYSCTEETLVETSSNIFVIEAFLYESEPVKSINIKSTLPIGSTDSIAPGIDNAEVKIIKSGTMFSLIKTPDSSGYYHYEGNDLQINSSDYFKIEVTCDGRLAYGETIVPQKPQNVSLSAGSLLIPEFTFEDIRNGLDINDYLILLSWDNPDSSYYYVVVENLEQELTPILGDTFTNLTRIRRQITSPSKTSEYVLSPFTLSYLGNHRAIVYKVNQEYADLYETREQDSRNLQEPLTNIENGLGVFTAFASDTVTFTITRE